jgi:hypothetical protein
MASTDRFANVLGKQLGPQWQILRWWEVVVRRSEEWSSTPHWEKFLFSEKKLAEDFTKRAKGVYSQRQIFCYPVYVLTANGGRTAQVLRRIARKPRKSTVLPLIP